MGMEKQKIYDTNCRLLSEQRPYKRTILILQDLLLIGNFAFSI